MQSALAKGFNFAVAPSRIPYERIICGVESAVRILPTAQAEQVRQDAAAIVRKARRPPSNITTAELEAIKSLRENENIVVLPADKGNATVVLDSSEYKDKISALLNDTTYRPIKRNPTNSLEKRTRALIKASPIDLRTQRFLLPQEHASRVPRLYGLPKIHKAGRPLRPIVSAVDSPTQPLAKYLAKMLQPHSVTAKSYVKNAAHLVSLLRDMKLGPDDLLVSFDIVSLFTKIPVDEAINTIKAKLNLPDFFAGLLRHCMSSTYFVFDGHFYEQVEGAPMGSPLSPVVANLFLEDFETRALDSAADKPSCWLRYVDDTFVVWPHGPDKLQNFLRHINSVHPNINFTMETEVNNKLPFLDCLVLKKPDGTLGHTVYRKPTHTDRYLHATSHHPGSQLRSVANSLAHRSKTIADADHLDQEARHLRLALRQNGFSHGDFMKAWNLEPAKANADPEPSAVAFLPYVSGTTDRIARLLATANIKTVFTADRKIGEMLRSVKDRIPLEEKGVYEVPCGDCEKTYVGQTSRHMSTRLREHRRAVDQGQSTSSLFQHFEKTAHTIDFDGIKSLAAVSHYTARTIREAIEIERRPHNMNKRDDSIRLAHAWKPVTEKILVAPIDPSESSVERSRPSEGQSPGHETISTGEGGPASRTRAAATRAGKQNGNPATQPDSTNPGRPGL